MVTDKQGHIASNAAFFAIFGFLLAMLGVIALIAPFVAGLRIDMVLGVLVLGRAAMQFYYGIKVRNWGHLVGPYMGMGSILMSHISVACATLLLMAPFSYAEYTRPVIGCYLLLNGAADLFHAFELRPVRGWAILIPTALASLVLAFVVWLHWPVGGAAGLGGGIGGIFVLGGASLVVLGALGRGRAVPRTFS